MRHYLILALLHFTGSMPLLACRGRSQLGSSAWIPQSGHAGSLTEPTTGPCHLLHIYGFAPRYYYETISKVINMRMSLYFLDSINSKVELPNTPY